MLRLEYVEAIGSYRIYNTNAPTKTVGYESDYYVALERVNAYNASV